MLINPTLRPPPSILRPPPSALRPPPSALRLWPLRCHIICCCISVHCQITPQIQTSHYIYFQLQLCLIAQNCSVISNANRRRLGVSPRGSENKRGIFIYFFAPIFNQERMNPSSERCQFTQWQELQESRMQRGHNLRKDWWRSFLLWSQAAALFSSQTHRNTFWGWKRGILGNLELLMRLMGRKRSKESSRNTAMG